jgi:hypothetical protein
MFKKLASVTVLVVLSVLSQAVSAQENIDPSLLARRHGGSYNGDFRQKHNYPKNQDEQDAEQNAIDAQNSADDDRDVVAAVERRRGLNFVQGMGMTVSQLMKDDTSGLQHQKFIVTLSSGATVQIVYNLDMPGCDRVPVKVGDKVGVGGQFLMTNEGPMLHWTHYDPKRNRPDGFVELNGTYYCKDGARR